MRRCARSCDFGRHVASSIEVLRVDTRAAPFVNQFDRLDLRFIVLGRKFLCERLPPHIPLCLECALTLVEFLRRKDMRIASIPGHVSASVEIFGVGTRTLPRIWDVHSGRRTPPTVQRREALYEELSTVRGQNNEARTVLIFRIIYLHNIVIHCALTLVSV